MTSVLIQADSGSFFPRRGTFDHSAEVTDLMRADIAAQINAGALDTEDTERVAIGAFAHLWHLTWRQAVNMWQRHTGKVAPAQH